MTPEAERIFAAALSGSGPPTVARDDTGEAVVLATARWLAAAADADLRMLGRAVGPVLDIGCGPGRHVRALAEAGVPALGIDASPSAVRLARARGTHVLQCSIFGPVPSAGRWRTALLLDGNIGIGGDPAALLLRTSELLAPGGVVLCECEAPGTGLRAGPVRLERVARTSRWFPWARVGVDALREPAEQAGLHEHARWEDGGRWFAELRRS